MKIPGSVRNLFAQIEPHYILLKEAVDRIVLQHKEPRWHYESRIKGEESFTLKLETGRVPDPAKPEDLFACTLVVENHSRLADAEKFIRDNFDVTIRRPNDPLKTHLEPYSFDFDDLRLYVTWKEDPAVRPSGFAAMPFEVQIKTFLQHAWGIATHDFIYKANDVDWSSSRIAYQVKAMLENAELSIGEATRLTDCAMLNRSDRNFSDLKLTIGEIRDRWKPDQLPTDLKRLAQNVTDLSYALQIDIPDIWVILDTATMAGRGTNTTNLSPISTIIAELISARGAALFDPLDQARAKSIFIPLEVTVPPLPSKIVKRIIRPPK